MQAVNEVHRRASCVVKKRYETRFAALRIAKAMRERKGKDRRPILCEIYRCRYCHGYHLTSARQEGLNGWTR
jgi:hypothetical protein